MMPNQKIKEFLDRIAKLESNSGQNINHKMMTRGIQAGTTAIGKYGLMPNTVKEIISNKIKYGQATPELKAIANLTPDQIKMVLEHKPELQDQLAESYAKTVMLKKLGDPDQMAYSWFNGPNSHPTAQQLNNSDYVRKFRNVASVINLKNQTSDIPTPRDVSSVSQKPDITEEEIFAHSQSIPQDELNQDDEGDLDREEEKEIEETPEMQSDESTEESDE